MLIVIFLPGGLMEGARRINDAVRAGVQQEDAVGKPTEERG
jgi:hypothetical protein